MRVVASLFAVAVLSGLVACKGSAGECQTTADCVGGDVCVSNTCISVCRRDSECGQGQVCGAQGACEASVCQAPCDDSDVCTQSDACVEGQCQGTPVTCEARNTCYEAGSCNSADGTCNDVQRADGSTCIIGSDAGLCEGGLCAVDCSRNGEICGNKQSCDSGRCRILCTAAKPCPTPALACEAGRCVAAENPPPVLTHIEGNHADGCPATPGVACLLDGFVVQGGNLVGASFLLKDDKGTNVVGLATHGAITSSLAEFILPPGITAGNYTLTATNAHGSAIQALQLLQGPPGPDLDGEGVIARINSAARGTISAARLPNFTPPGPGSSEANAGQSCAAILADNSGAKSGLYWLKPVAQGGAAFRAQCEMTVLNGGWTLVMNIHPADGGVVNFPNEAFWRDEAEYGSVDEHFTHDYKSPAAYRLTGQNILIVVAKPGAKGKPIGWKAWTMANKSLDTFFDSANNTIQTTGELGKSVDNVYQYEPIIRNGTHLVSNKTQNANNDRARLGVDSYSKTLIENSQPGLGTLMDSAHGNNTGANAGRSFWVSGDVELWWTSGGWDWDGVPGRYKDLGTDRRCGGGCAMTRAGGGAAYSPYWTYRIYVR